MLGPRWGSSIPKWGNLQLEGERSWTEKLRQEGGARMEGKSIPNRIIGIHSMPTQVNVDLTFVWKRNSVPHVWQLQGWGGYAWNISFFKLYLTIVYSCPMKTQHPPGALSWVLSKVVYKFVLLYSTIKATFLHNNLNSNDPANIRRNVSLQITLIAFLAYTKNPKNFVQMFSVGQ